MTQTDDGARRGRGRPRVGSVAVRFRVPKGLSILIAEAIQRADTASKLGGGRGVTASDWWRTAALTRLPADLQTRYLQGREGEG